MDVGIRAGTGIPTLTGLRFFAAMAVVLFHFGARLGLPGPILRVFDGPAAVSFFFVLSGFILMYNYDSYFRSGVGLQSYLRFMRKRVARIFPVHLVCLLAATPMALLAYIYAPKTFAQFVGGAIAPGELLSSWIANLTLTMVYIPTLPYILPWNPPAWSIAAEMFFYIFFPFIAFALAGLTRLHSIVFAIGTIYLGQIITFVAGVFWLDLTGATPQPWYLFNLALYGMPPFRIFEFAAGCCAALILLRGHAIRLPRGLTPARVAAGAMAIVALVLLPPPIQGEWAQWGMMIRQFAPFTLPFLVIILMMATGSGPVERFIGSAPLLLLGEASYSLYMMHWLGLTLWNYWLAWDPFKTWVLTLAMIPASILMYLFIERPARSWIVKNLSTERAAKRAKIV